MDHIVLNLKEGTYLICDKAREVAKHTRFKIHNLQRIFSREKKNLVKEDEGVYILRVPEKNKKYNIDGTLE